MTPPFLFSLCMSLREELVMCFHEELKGVVSSILGCMIKNIWGCSMCITVGPTWLFFKEVIYNVCDGQRMRVW